MCRFDVAREGALLLGIRRFQQGWGVDRFLALLDVGILVALGRKSNGNSGRKQVPRLRSE
jgi:hypothetical protein